MNDFHYNYIKQKYGNKAKLLFTDTDSLTYEIEAEDVYQDFRVDKNKFDKSDYPKDNLYFNPTNKKVISKFKDDTKMYSYVKDDGKGGKTVKGMKKDIKHENHKRFYSITSKCIIK